MRHHRATAFGVVIALIYGAAHLTWYLGTPLGQVPVLDERENVQLASAIAQGTLPHEPFYRAMGFPLILSIVPALGGSDATTFTAGLGLGLLLHGIGALLAAHLATRWFGNPRAGAVGGTLFALNPVFVHHATQLVDSTLGMVLMLAALATLPLPKYPPQWRALLLTGLWTGFAIVVRPNYLVFAAAILMGAFWLHRTDTTPRVPRLVLLWLLFGISIPILAYSTWQWRVGGEFGLLPQQGPYNLWAANRPGTHGRYFAQSIALPPNQSHQNPTRVESVVLYCAETGMAVPQGLTEVNAHWNRRLISEISTHPTEWLRVLLRKFYALCNDWEQYNNKTYAFHKADSPLLRPNPIGWGLLLLLALPGAWALAGRDRALALFVGQIGVAVAISVLLAYVSSRFRLPLEALLCVLAGGVVPCAGIWRSLPRIQKQAMLTSVLCAGIVTFSRFDGVRDQRTYLQDHLLIASAAEQVGDDHSVWTHARSAHRLAPGNPDAVREMVAAYFNLLLAGTAPLREEGEWLAASRQLLSQTAATSDPLAPIAALALWRAGDSAGATLWESLLGPTTPPITRATAAAALVLADRRNPATLGAVEAPHPFLLQVALGETAGLSSAQIETVRALFRQHSAAHP